MQFRPNAGDIRGELVWIASEAYARILEELDAYERIPDLFRRKVIRVETAQGDCEAWAYEWAGTREVVEEYLFAVSRKLAIGAYHLSHLKALSKDELVVGNHSSIPLQAHFEALLAAAVAASDQLAEALNLGLGLGLMQANLQEIIEALGQGSLRRHLTGWYQRPIAADYREVRRLVMHHWLVKTPEGPTVQVQPVQRGRYTGSRDVVTYAEAVVEHLTALEAILEDVRDSLELQPFQP